QLVAQLGLADEDNLKELSLVGLEVRKKPNLLEQLGPEVLGFIDEENDVISLGHLIEKIGVQELQVRGAVELLRLFTELQQDRPHQLRAREDRVEDERGAALGGKLAEDRPTDRGLAGAHFAGDLNEALALADPEEDVIERFSVLVREEEKAGIRGDVERRLAKAVELVVHPGGRIALLSDIRIDR